jgi:hypothetical protein
MISNLNEIIQGRGWTPDVPSVDGPPAASEQPHCTLETRRGSTRVPALGAGAIAGPDRAGAQHTQRGAVPRARIASRCRADERPQFCRSTALDRRGTHAAGASQLVLGRLFPRPADLGPPRKHCRISSGARGPERMSVSSATANARSRRVARPSSILASSEASRFLLRKCTGQKLARVVEGAALRRAELPSSQRAAAVPCLNSESTIPSHYSSSLPVALPAVHVRPILGT